MEKVASFHCLFATTPNFLLNFRFFIFSSFYRVLLLGMRNVFRGITITSWTENNCETSEDLKHNKIIVKESVMICNECWVDGCNAIHSEEEQKKVLIQSHGNMFDEMMNGESEARRHAERTKFEIDRAQNETIRSWILGALKMKRKLKKHP